MPRYEVPLSDGRTATVDSPTELTEDQIQSHVLANLNQGPTITPPFGGRLAHFLAPTVGAAAADIATGALMGSAVEPGIGTVVGGIAAPFLGALAGSRARQLFQSRATGQPPETFGAAVKEAIPFGAFGAGSQLAGAGLRAVAPALENAPRFLRAFARPSTIASAALRGTAGGTATGVVQGEDLPTAAKQGLASGAVAGGLQSLPNFLGAASGNRPRIQAAESKFSHEADAQVQAMRVGKLPEYLSTRGHEIFDKVKQVAATDPTPIPLKELYDTAVSKYGSDSPQVVTLLKAFGRDPATVLGFSQKALAGTTIESPTGEVMTLPGENPILAKIFEGENVAPSKALDVASSLSSKVKGGAASGFRRGFSMQDSVNNDARSVIYDVIKNRVTPEGRQAIADAMEEYGEFATLRDQALRTISPFGNAQTPTKPGITFLQRIASGESTPQTADDLRLKQFLGQATGQPIGQGLPQLFQDIKGAQGQARTAQYAARRLGYIGIGYPILRTILRGGETRRK